MLKITQDELREHFKLWKQSQLSPFGLIAKLDAYLNGKSITQERSDSIMEAVKKYHVDRGCCNGIDFETCTFKIEKIPPVEREKIEKHNFKLEE